MHGSLMWFAPPMTSLRMRHTETKSTERTRARPRRVHGQRDGSTDSETGPRTAARGDGPFRPEDARRSRQQQQQVALNEVRYREAELLQIGTMSCNWGTELWDQFDNLEKHTNWGIDFLERYTKFVKERADIELSYAKQIRSLSKKFHLKRSREDDSRSVANPNMMDVGWMGGWMNVGWMGEWMDSKRRFERDCKEAERAQHVSDRIDLDNKADGEKVLLTLYLLQFRARCSLKARQAAQQKQQAAEESRKEYVTSLNQFNQDQHQHYRTLVPVIYQLLQTAPIE
ncbi:PREDICTED: formin-binding protein 1-like [Poecilia mexicana]|uniref:formin-binding protein 1-like n=1 Tax=Poecilia mexicana TaxID=48701 RepID=UPI00072DE9E0|nr:PREDICTED: formin-binding protein 1-like [Poecilia mexicana]